jgi:hypothetical protein
MKEGLPQSFTHFFRTIKDDFFDGSLLKEGLLASSQGYLRPTPSTLNFSIITKITDKKD